jgi:hypothetical protein
MLEKTVNSNSYHHESLAEKVLQAELGGMGWFGWFRMQFSDECL